MTYSPIVRTIRATRCSVGIAFLMMVSVFAMVVRSFSHRYRKVSWDIRKFSSQSRGVNVEFTTCSHQWLLLSFAHSVLTGGQRKLEATTANTSINTKRSWDCLLAKALLRLMLCFILQFTHLKACRFLANK